MLGAGNKILEDVPFAGSDPELATLDWKSSDMVPYTKGVEV